MAVGDPLDSHGAHHGRQLTAMTGFDATVGGTVGVDDADGSLAQGA